MNARYGENTVGDLELIQNVNSLDKWMSWFTSFVRISSIYEECEVRKLQNEKNLPRLGFEPVQNKQTPLWQQIQIFQI